MDNARTRALPEDPCGGAALRECRHLSPRIACATRHFALLLRLALGAFALLLLLFALLRLLFVFAAIAALVGGRMHVRAFAEAVWQRRTRVLVNRIDTHSR